MKAKGNEKSIVNGARQNKKKNVISVGYRTRVASRWIRVDGVLNQYPTLRMILGMDE
jgi:hypothetical protein